MRSLGWIPVFVLPFALQAGCRSVEVVGGDGGGASRAVTSTDAVGGAAGEGGSCNTPPPPSSTQPTGPGCYENDMGSGWYQVPCSCEMWLRNTTHAGLGATIELHATPTDPPPTLDGSFDAGLDVVDPDGSWFSVWAAQPGNGVTFRVTRDGDTTRVRLGVSDLTLRPVVVEACTTRKGQGRLVGPMSAQLAAHAVLDDGTVVDLGCKQTPVTPPAG